MPNMTFDTLEERMRQFETATDRCVPPGNWIVIRLDGRGFTKQTREKWILEAPFDARFHDAMIQTVSYLMCEAGFNVMYGYTQSDEISLLLALDDATFNRKHRKLNSILAGYASAKFSSAIGGIAVFDARVIELPNTELVADEFWWRQWDATRNALNSWCYWTLRKEGRSVGEATSFLEGKGDGYKNELLFQRGINFNDIPTWQKRGTGIYWQTYTKVGFNPIAQQEVPGVIRRKLSVNSELPYPEAEYREFIKDLCVAGEVAKNAS